MCGLGLPSTSTVTTSTTSIVSASTIANHGDIGSPLGGRGGLPDERVRGAPQTRSPATEGGYYNDDCETIIVRPMELATSASRVQPSVAPGADPSLALGGADWLSLLTSNIYR